MFCVTASLAPSMIADTVVDEESARPLICELSMRVLLAMIVLFVTSTLAGADSWPPALRGATDGLLVIEARDLLAIPPKAADSQANAAAAKFVVAQTTPRVELRYHTQLGPDAIDRRLWSSWGDICVASDGRVYCAIGDHGQDQAGDARCFVYVWEPESKQLRQIVDMNEVVPPKPGQPAWSKVHAKIDEGPDGRIYFSCTLNDGNRARDVRYGFNDALTGGQIYAYHPKSGQTQLYASLPERRCTATSLYDRERHIWWCNLEAGNGNTLWGMDLTTRKVVFKGQDGQVALKSNRAFALLNNGTILFNGTQSLMRLDPRLKLIQSTRTTLQDSPGMRCATRQAQDGAIFGVTHVTNQLFRYDPATDAIKYLGPTFLTGEYTTVCELSPDEKYLYYLPGSHGKAWEYGTPVIQYQLETGTRKVLAFLAPAVSAASDYVPAGTYGMKLSADGSVIYVNFNGHAADTIRPEKMKPNGFGLTAFAAIHVPAEERK